jgi:hypothetical protein
MTPQERQLVDELFDRLARLETAPRDADAERAIVDGLRRAPNAVYALVQTTLVQDEALKRADARIRELSGEAAAPDSPGFLDSMREAFTGRSRTSVPSVRASAANQSDARWNTGGAMPNAGAAQAAPYAAAPVQAGGFGGGSFLGTAAASAAGMIGGSLLLNSISSMFGHRGGGQAFASTPSDSNSPWDNKAANSDLAREAGLNDVGGRGGVNDPQAAGLIGNDTNDNDDYSNDLAGDPGGDFDGGGDFGGGDTA